MIKSEVKVYDKFSFSKYTDLNHILFSVTHFVTLVAGIIV